VIYLATTLSESLFLLQNIECFAVSRVTNVTSAADAAGLYSNVVIITVQSEAARQHQSDVHLFHAATKQQVHAATQAATQRYAQQTDADCCNFTDNQTGCNVSGDTLQYRLEVNVSYRHTRQVTQLFIYLLTHNLLSSCI